MALIGLEGVKQKEVQEVFFETSDDLLSKIEQGNKYLTTAQYNGAINVWLDDSGMWHCESMRFCRPLEKIQTRHLSAVKTWIKPWLKKIQ